MSGRLKVVVLLVALGFATTGCGFGLSGPDPQQPRDEMPKCDSGKGAVVVDGLMATVLSVAALAIIADDEPAIALLPAGLAAVYIGGAVHGSRAVDSCRKAMDDWGGMVAARDELRRGPPGGVDEEDPRPRRPRVKLPTPEEAANAQQVPPQQLPPQPYVPPPQQYPPQQVPPQQQVPQQVPQQQAPQQQAPPQQVPPQPKQPKQAPKQAPPPSDDAWDDFWREVQ